MSRFVISFLYLNMMIFLGFVLCSCSIKKNESMRLEQQKILPIIIEVELDATMHPTEDGSKKNIGVDVYVDIKNNNPVDIELQSIQILVERSQLKLPLYQILPNGNSTQMHYFIETNQTPSLYQVYVQVSGKHVLGEQIAVGVFQNELPPYPTDMHMDHLE